MLEGWEHTHVRDEMSSPFAFGGASCLQNLTQIVTIDRSCLGARSHNPTPPPVLEMGSDTLDIPHPQLAIYLVSQVPDCPKRAKDRGEVLPGFYRTPKNT